MYFRRRWSLACVVFLVPGPVAAAPVVHVDANTLVALPDGDPPADGWPNVVLLHGHNSSLKYQKGRARALADGGLAVVAVAGTVALANGNRGWPRDDVAAVDHHLSRWLERVAERHKLDGRRQFIGGFSQGAAYALRLLLANPGSYRGGLIMSLVETPSIGSEATKPALPPVWITAGQADPKAYQIAQDTAGRLRAIGTPVRLDLHIGGHELPPDWKQVLPSVARWLLAGGAADPGGL